MNMRGLPKRLFADLRPDGGVLTDREILRAHQRGELGIDPFDRTLLRPAALGLRLGFTASVLRSRGAIELGQSDTHPQLDSCEPDELGRLRLEPGEVMLAPTLERLWLSPRLAGLIDGTSDYARLGISVVLSHQVSPGYGSDCVGGAIITLEIVSRLSTVYLRPGTRIGNLMLFRCSPVDRAYPAMPFNYSRDVLAQASRIGESCSLPSDQEAEDEGSSRPGKWRRLSR